ncbi:MAG: hypothetical protein NW224_30640 [Leptolyngbyaceae cyanobacterium bins.302]|nr:hypothetical protein [Leptolyngbyaceae cyanobacterium bins.302]
MNKMPVRAGLADQSARCSELNDKTRPYQISLMVSAIARVQRAIVPALNNIIQVQRAIFLASNNAKGIPSFEELGYP